MTEHLLTLNAGSSSMKFALFARDALGAPPVFAGQIDTFTAGCIHVIPLAPKAGPESIPSGQ